MLIILQNPMALNFITKSSITLLYWFTPPMTLNICYTHIFYPLNVNIKESWMYKFIKNEGVQFKLKA